VSGPTSECRADRAEQTTQFRSALTCPGHQGWGLFPFLAPNDLRRQSLPDPTPPGRNRTQARPYDGRGTDPNSHRLFGTPGQSSKEGLKAHGLNEANSAHAIRVLSGAIGCVSLQFPWHGTIVHVPVLSSIPREGKGRQSNSAHSRESCESRRKLGFPFSRGRMERYKVALPRRSAALICDHAS
jgi:hypothetical protein